MTLIPALAVSGNWLTDSGLAVRREQSGMARRRVRLIFRKTTVRRLLAEKIADLIAAYVPDMVYPEKRS